MEGLRKDIEMLHMIKEYPELLKRNQELNAQNAALSKENSQLKATNVALPQPVITSTIVDALKGPWQIVCDRCNTPFNAELTIEQVEGLYKTGYVELECSTPSCAQAGNRVRRSLAQLIGTRTKSQPPVGRYTIVDKPPKGIGLFRQ